MSSSISRSSWYPLILLSLDTALTTFALWLAYFVRFNTGIIPVRGTWDPIMYARVWPFVVFLLVVSFSIMRLYDFGARTFGLDIFQRIVTGTFLGATLFVALEYFLRTHPFSRIVTTMSIISVISTISIGRYYISAWLISRRMVGKDVLRVGIVGTGRAADAISRRIADNPQYGFECVGFIEENGEATTNKSKVRLGHINNLKQVLSEHSLDLVIVASPHIPHEEMVKIFQQCEREFVGCKFAPDLFELLLRDMKVDDFEGIPLLSLKETPLQGWNSILKRLFDAFAAVTLLLVTSPLFALIAIAIKLESTGPIFYIQERMGLDGRLFKIIKFRSMTANAEPNGPVWSQDHDPRRTRVGRVIRTLNLDELPQLFNVIMGQMSLVGPRPERPHFIDQFKTHLPRYMARHRVRAGITGWAQVNGMRGNTSINDRLKYDLYYVENWSFWFDIKILIMTIWGRRTLA